MFSTLTRQGGVGYARMVTEHRPEPALERMKVALGRSQLLDDDRIRNPIDRSFRLIDVEY